MNRALNKILRNRVTIPFTPFYRRYPYKNGIAIDSADDRGCVDMELGFFYNRIPKAANSTVVTNLARLKFGREIASKAAKKMFKTPSALHAREVSQFSFLFTFTVVRNPYTRTLSAYLDKVERRALRDNKESSFRDFLYSLQKGKLYSNAHWAPQSALLLLPADQFDFIGKVESIDTDLPYIKQKLQGKRPEKPFKSTLNNSTGASRKLRAYYDTETAEIVRMLFRNDFETFGYPDGLPVMDDIRPETGNTGS
ncbi:MAG: sulfotransferase family protein [Thermodesulfobacteriota bacterium]